MTEQRIVQIVAALNRERAYKIIRPGAGWGKADWLEEAVQGRLCSPVSRNDILADAYKRDLLTPEEREHFEAQARATQAARALRAIPSAVRSQASRDNGMRPVRNGSKPRGRPRKAR